MHHGAMDLLDISCDPQRIDLGFVHGFLSRESYWARGIPPDTLQRAVRHSLCFGGWLGERQVAFARVVTDYATFAWIADVFVDPAFRGRGFSKQLMAAVAAHPQLQGLRRRVLATRDAHGLYAQFGFEPLANPERFMERHFPNVYSATSAPPGR
jgi:GNAT superfamily N-acetyltransferase